MDNTVTIRNKTTGEMRKVPVSSLSSYGIGGGSGMPQMGVDTTPYDFGSTSSQPQQSGGIINALLGKAINVAKDVGTGIRSRMEQGNLNKQSDVAKNLEDQAYATMDMAKRKALLQSANNFRTNVSSEAGNIGQSFSPDINENPLIRALLAATQIGTTASLPSDIMAAPGIVKGIAQRLTPGGVANLSEQVVTKNIGKGAPHLLSDIKAEALKEITKRYGNNAEFKNALDTVLSKTAPAPTNESKIFMPSSAMPQGGSFGMIGEPKLDELGLYQMRKVLGELYGYSNKLKTPAEDKAGQILRGVLSKRLKTAVPEIKSLDRLATTYGRLGRVPGVVKYGAGGLAASEILRRLIGGQSTSNVLESL